PPPARAGHFGGLRSVGGTTSSTKLNNNNMPNLTPKFRHALKGELQGWLEQGLLTAEAGQRLRALYRLDELGQESSRRLAAVIFHIGGLLVGGGVISFV